MVQILDAPPEGVVHARVELLMYQPKERISKQLQKRKREVSPRQYDLWLRRVSVRRQGRSLSMGKNLRREQMIGLIAFFKNMVDRLP